MSRSRSLILPRCFVIYVCPSITRFGRASQSNNVRSGRTYRARQPTTYEQSRKSSLLLIIFVMGCSRRKHLFSHLPFFLFPSSAAVPPMTPPCRLLSRTSGLCAGASSAQVCKVCKVCYLTGFFQSDLASKMSFYNLGPSRGRPLKTASFRCTDILLHCDPVVLQCFFRSHSLVLTSLFARYVCPLFSRLAVYISRISNAELRI